MGALDSGIDRLGHLHGAGAPERPPGRPPRVVAGSWRPSGSPGRPTHSTAVFRHRR